MKRNFKILSFVALLIASNIILAQEPIFELKDIDNKIVSYDDVKGDKLTVIDFWATWCQPCLRSIPEINSLFLEFKDEGVNFVGISIDGPRNQAKLKPFVNSIGVEYTILRDVNSELMTEMNVSVVPTLLIIDQDGEIVFTHEGFRPGDDKHIRKSIEKHL